MRKADFFEHNRNVEALIEKKCMYSDCQGNQCSEPAIGSHSLQRRGPLAAISEDHHVLKFGYDKGSIPSLQVDPIDKQGTKKHASVFHGFCANHDDNLFREIEPPDGNLLPRHAALFHYRAICMELFKAKYHGASLDLLRSGERIQNRPEPSEYLSKEKAGNEYVICDLQRTKQHPENSLEKNDFKLLRSIAVEFDQTLPFASTGGFIPARTFSGASCLPDQSRKKLLETVSLFIGTVGQRHVAILTGVQFSKSHFIEKFISSFLNVPMQMRSAYLLNLALSHIENTFFRPGWYKGLPQNDRDYILSKFKELERPRGYQQYYLIPNRKLHTTVSSKIVRFEN